jgi:hypothetical protein
VSADNLPMSVNYLLVADFLVLPLDFLVLVVDDLLVLAMLVDELLSELLRVLVDVGFASWNEHRFQNSFGFWHHKKNACLGHNDDNKNLLHNLLNSYKPIVGFESNLLSIELRRCSSYSLPICFVVPIHVHIDDIFCHEKYWGIVVAIGLEFDDPNYESNLLRFCRSPCHPFLLGALAKTIFFSNLSITYKTK